MQPVFAKPMHRALAEPIELSQSAGRGRVLAASDSNRETARMTDSTVRIAVVQQPPVLLDRDATMKEAISNLHAAADAGAGLAVFPEAYIPGYPIWIWNLRPGPDYGLTSQIHRELLENSVDLDADELAPLRDAASERAVTVVCGVHERDGSFGRATIYNTLVTIGPDGNILNRHDDALRFVLGWQKCQYIHAGHQHLQNQHENRNGGEKSSGGGHAQRAEHVVENNFGMVAHLLPAAAPILVRLQLRGGDSDAHGKIRRGRVFRHAREQYREFPVALQLPAARFAGFQMLANGHAFFGACRSGQRVVQITRQSGAYCIALHGRSSLAELVRKNLGAEETVGARA